MDKGFSFGVMDMFGARKRWWLCNTVNILNVT